MIICLRELKRPEEPDQLALENGIEVLEED
jgi:hypothetical protein